MGERVKTRVPDLSGNITVAIGRKRDKPKNIDVIFNEYYDKWYNETKYLSSPKMFENKNYKTIISLGGSVVPSIIRKLRETPAHLFEALVAITGQDPVPESHWGDIDQMSQDWINWWEEKGRA